MFGNSNSSRRKFRTRWASYILILYGYDCRPDAAPDNISLLVQPQQNDHNQQWKVHTVDLDCGREPRGGNCGRDHYDLHSHVRQFFICVFHLSFGGYCRHLVAGRGHRLCRLSRTLQSSNSEVVTFRTSLVGPEGRTLKIRIIRKGRQGRPNGPPDRPRLAP